jgi:hypothetical protein
MNPLLVCLVAGYLLAEFWLVPLRPAADRRHPGPLLRDAAIVVVALAVVCLPFGPTAIWPLLAGLAVARAAIDLAAAGLARRPGFLRQGELWLFLGAQTLMLLAIAAGWRWLGAGATAGSSLVPAPVVPRWAQVVWTAGSLALVTRGGLVLVDRTLRQVPVLSATGDNLRTGRIIGVLERLLVFFLVVQGEWGAVGLVVAAKSIIRFKDLEQRHFAEYYLIGTLTSLLVAGVAGGITRVILRSF